MLKTMAKKQLPPEKNRTPNNNSKTPARAKSKAKTKNFPRSISKSSNKNRSSFAETANGDASSEDTEVSIAPSSSVETEKNEVVDSSEAEDDGVERRSSSDEEEEEEEEEEKEEEKKRRSIKRKGKRNDAKSKGKKRTRKEKDELKRGSALYTFPMNRIRGMVKSAVNPDVKIAQEAVFVINRASEKFLQVFCKEAYACAFLDKRKQITYKHLSSVVSKRMRFQFASDFVPEMVKAEDALAQVAEAEK